MSNSADPKLCISLVRAFSQRAFNVTHSTAGILLVLKCPFDAALVVENCSESLKEQKILRLQTADIFFISAGSRLIIVRIPAVLHLYS